MLKFELSIVFILAVMGTTKGSILCGKLESKIQQDGIGVFVYESNITNWKDSNIFRKSPGVYEECDSNVTRKENPSTDVMDRKCKKIDIKLVAGKTDQYTYEARSRLGFGSSMITYYIYYQYIYCIILHPQ